MLGAVCAPRCYLAQCDESSSPHILLVSLSESEYRNSLCHQRNSRAPFTHHVQHDWSEAPIRVPVCVTSQGIVSLRKHVCVPISAFL